MTTEQKFKIDEYPILANRGEVHEFIETNGERRGKRVLIVSAQRRNRDRLVSIMFLQDRASRVSSAAISVSDTEEQYVNGGLVTYCARTCIGDYIYTAKPDEMKMVDKIICEELGIARS